MLAVSERRDGAAPCRAVADPTSSARRNTHVTPIIYLPDPRYRTKLFLDTLVVGALALFGSVPFVALIAADASGAKAALVGAAIAVVANLVWLVPTLVLIVPYCRSLQYEIREDEVIVRAGIVTKSVKHVPYRTVTNLKVARGPFDRLLGIGSMDIQTAGMSGKQGAEEHLAGLVEVDQVYDQVATALRRFRSALPPTQGGAELPAGGVGDTAAIVNELRAIRQLLSELRPAR
jgi:hypothetical protein